MWVKGKGLFVYYKKESIFISNFKVEVVEVYDTQEGKEVVLKLTFASENVTHITILIDRINKLDWFQLDTRCIVSDIKYAQNYLKLSVRRQIAEYENSVEKITQYTELGWNYNAIGNVSYVTGNVIIGGTDNEKVVLALEQYRLQFHNDKQDEMLKLFVKLFDKSPLEGDLLLLYFFTGLIKSLYKEAGIPVDFVFYIYGEQQSRKTTLVRLTNNLYNRSDSMDFSLRTLAMTSEAMSDKLISAFKDTTLILDDLSMTNDKQNRQKQERVMEHVVRMLGNRTRKSSNMGNAINEYFPNANVVITGEYLPNFPESTLSRMLIMELKHPVDSNWLIEFGKDPLMLSTVAYNFISWIQRDYSKYVDIIRKNFEQYREERREKPAYQERISEHAFIMSCTSSLLYEFLTQKGYGYVAQRISIKNVKNIRCLLENQVVLMDKSKIRGMERDFCHAFAELYIEKQIDIAKVGADCREMYDAFMLDKHTICISTAKMCELMRIYYEDFSITIQAITRQLKNNCFLITDNSRQSKATKKVGKIRYLHISKEVVKDYYEYCC